MATVPTLLQHVERWATPLRVGLVFVAALAFSAWFFTVGPYAQMADHGGIVDERFGITPSGIADAIDAYGDDGRADYRVFLLADLVFPLLHASWLFGFIALGRRRWKALPQWTLWFPVVALVADWSENLAFYVLTAGSASPAIASIGWLAMHVKLVANVASFLTAAAILVWYVMNPVQRRSGRVIDR